MKETGEAAAEEEPDILFTSLVDSKGLSAEHVFVFGMNENHFPRHAGTTTEDEVCSFLVALSRTPEAMTRDLRRVLGADKSVFLSWIERHLERLEVRKGYDLTA